MEMMLNRIIPEVGIFICLFFHSIIISQRNDINILLYFFLTLNRAYHTGTRAKAPTIWWVLFSSSY